MTNNTKQSEETFIQWRIAGNPVVSGESASEAILTIHPDGRVTTSDRLKPTEAAALVLDQIKTQWMRDGQATKIRQLQDRIKRLEEAVDAYRKAYTPDGHVAPHDCFATGPKTGNPYQDLFACPGCWAELKAKEAKP